MTVLALLLALMFPANTLTTWEDGSGVLRNKKGQTVVKFREGTFPWDCRTQGNRRCGP